VKNNEIIEYYYKHISKDREAFYDKGRDSWFYKSNSEDVWFEHSSSDVFFHMRPEVEKYINQNKDE